MDRNACDAVLIDSLRTDTGTEIHGIDGTVGSNIGKRRTRRNACTYFVCRADCRADCNSGTYRHTRAETHCHTRTDSCPYAGTYGSADGRTCPGAGQYELWCCAL